MARVVASHESQQLCSAVAVSYATALTLGIHALTLGALTQAIGALTADIQAPTLGVDVLTHCIQERTV